MSDNGRFPRSQLRLGWDVWAAFIVLILAFLLVAWLASCAHHSHRPAVAPIVEPCDEDANRPCGDPRGDCDEDRDDREPCDVPHAGG